MQNRTYESIRTQKSRSYQINPISGTSTVHPISSGVTDPNNEDRLNCGLRAYCNITGKSYRDAQIIFAKQGRKYKRGTDVVTLSKIMRNAGLKPKLMGSTRSVKYIESSTELKSTGASRTIKSLLNDKEYQQGKHVFCTIDHAFCVIDGKVLDTFSSSASARVYVVYSAE